MRYTDYLLVDSEHWNNAKKHKDHQIAIDYFNRYNLPDNAIICWQPHMLTVSIHYHGCIPEWDEEKISKSGFSKNAQIMLWKEFKELNKEDNK